MSLIPASRLTSSDLALLGNNLSPSRARRQTPQHNDLHAVNRSLAAHGERVGRLYRRLSLLRTAPISRRSTPPAA